MLSKTVVLFVGIGCLLAQDDSRASLRGIRKVDVSFSFMNLEENTETEIRTEVELALRQGGLAIGDTEFVGSNGAHQFLEEKKDRPPRLQFFITGIHTCDISLQLRQPVLLQRDSSIAVRNVETWTSEPLRPKLTDSCPDLRADAEFRVKEFLNAWLSANSPTHKATAPK